MNWVTHLRSKEVTVRNGQMRGFTSSNPSTLTRISGRSTEPHCHQTELYLTSADALPTSLVRKSGKNTSAMCVLDGLVNGPRALITGFALITRAQIGRAKAGNRRQTDTHTRTYGPRSSCNRYTWPTLQYRNNLLELLSFEEKESFLPTCTRAGNKLFANFLRGISLKVAGSSWRFRGFPKSYIIYS